MKKLIAILFILLVTVVTTLEFNEDLLKFMIGGNSATYEVHLVKQNTFIVATLSITVIGLIIANMLKSNKVIRYILAIGIIIWMFSIHKYVLIKDGDKVKVISAVAFVPINKYEVESYNDISTYNPLLSSKLNAATNKSSP